VAKARSLAAEVEAVLRGPDYRRLLEKMYGDKPDRWSDALEGIDRLRLIINAMTRLRVVDGEGRPVLKFKGEPGEANQEWVPWFDVSSRKSRDHTIVCGHWSALGLVVRGDLLALDSGCIWGRELTAARLADRTVMSVPCPAREGPED
jgi:bis(5'-nucleosyl)-tetraphosphatase (symmetrical)